jgi:hypothetical protein
MDYGYHHALNINRSLLNMKFIIFVFVHPQFGEYLGDVCRCFSIEPFFRALVIQILEQQKQDTRPEYLEHLLQVLFDQLKQAPAYSHYLPQSTHPVLRRFWINLLILNYFI